MGALALLSFFSFSFSLLSSFLSAIGLWGWRGLNLLPWVLERLEGCEVFVYVTRSAGAGGGLALYGVARGRAELHEKYWRAPCRKYTTLLAEPANIQITALKDSSAPRNTSPPKLWTRRSAFSKNSNE